MRDLTAKVHLKIRCNINIIADIGNEKCCILNLLPITLGTDWKHVSRMQNQGFSTFGFQNHIFLCPHPQNMVKYVHPQNMVKNVKPYFVGGGIGKYGFGTQRC